MGIAATYVSPVSFAVSAERAAEFAVGVRARADCGADGVRLGTVSGVAGTTVTLTMDGGSALTSNLTDVLHGNDTPASILSVPGHYARDVRFAAKPVSAAADRYTLLSPNRMTVDVSGLLLCLMAQQALDLSQAATWDSTTTDYTVAAARAGKDFYVYAVLVGGVALGLLVSANATYPVGHTVATSRKVGGFHCLCVSVGTISGHALSGYLAGDILPASVWDLKHRPVSAPEGMVYVEGLKWVDIYLASVSGGRLVSANGGVIADGASSPAFHWYKIAQWMGAVGKRLPTQLEFFAAALGANQGTNIAGSADPGTTGGHVDTAGRRMLSDVGCEDCCGVLWQWGAEAGGGAASAAYANAYDGNDSGVAGQHYQAPNRASWGGAWAGGAACGSRSSTWANGPLKLAEYFGARGVADAIEEIS